MTPEERATKWADQCVRHDCQCGAGFTPSDDFPCQDALATIRAAENDVLERAAIKLEVEAEKWRDEIADFGDTGNIRTTKIAALNHAASDIRALKHPTSHAYPVNAHRD